MNWEGSQAVRNPQRVRVDDRSDRSVTTEPTNACSHVDQLGAGGSSASGWTTRSPSVTSTELEASAFVPDLGGPALRSFSSEMC